MNPIGARQTYLHWLEDECFFSLCSRQHFFWANHSSEETLHSLFGSNSKLFSPDFPRYLNTLNEDATLVWGSSEQIISEHTISPIFFPFQSTEHVRSLKQAFNSSKLGSVKYKLGLLTSRFGGEHPLKACTICITSDHSLHGVAYWHLSHQFPGVITCPVHGCLLMTSKENRQWSRRLQWLLPDEFYLESSGQPAPSPSTLHILQSMSSAVIALAKLGIYCSFEPNKISHVYKESLSILEKNLHTREAVANSLAQYCSVLQPYPPFLALPCSQQSATNFITQMIRKPRGYYHPLKHLTLILWLFGRLESFVDAYQGLTEKQELFAIDNARAVNNIQVNDALLPNLAAHPYTPKPKPKKIFKEMKNEILEALADGTDKNDVCVKFKVSTSTVNRLLRLNILIKQQISHNKYIIKRTEHRKEWSSIVHNNPGISANDIKKISPNNYAWLYRNDRSWLAKKTSGLLSGRRGNNVRVDWDGRDEKLCSMIKKVFNERNANLSTIRKQDIYQLVPNLFSALEQRTHYPKTRKLLSEIIK